VHGRAPISTQNGGKKGRELYKEISGPGVGVEVGGANRCLRNIEFGVDRVRKGDKRRVGGRKGADTCLNARSALAISYLSEIFRIGRKLRGAKLTGRMKEREHGKGAGQDHGELATVGGLISTHSSLAIKLRKEGVPARGSRGKICCQQKKSTIRRWDALN